MLATKFSPYRPRTHELLDDILETASQQETQEQREDRYPKLSQEAPSALEVFKDDILDTTAMLGLPRM